VAGSGGGIGRGGFAVLIFAEFAGTWLIYRDFPGFALTRLAIGLTDARVLLLPDAGRALFVEGNAVSYDASGYLAFVLRWRWKK
jgi:hypothetical protein